VKTLTLNEIVEDFEFLDDWEDRYRYIIELGDELAEMPSGLKTEANRVQGCVSNVWLVLEVEPGDPPLIRFIADSDSQIVRGLVAILLMLCSGRTGPEIQALDIESLFERLDLGKHLSRSRSNGLHSMIKRIRRLAEEHAEVALSS
jgi:cysteine desulfuration protein SufE